MSARPARGPEGGAPPAPDRVARTSWDGSARALRRAHAGRVRRRVEIVPLLVLACVWVALWGTPTPLSVAGGLIVAAVVLVLFPLPPLALGLRVAPVAFAWLVLRFAADLVVSSLRMAYDAVAPWVHPTGAFVRAPLEADDDLRASLTAELVSLIPGTLVVDLDTDRQEMLVHVFDAPDAASTARIVAEVRAQERRVLAAFPRRSERRSEGRSPGEHEGQAGARMPGRSDAGEGS